MMVLKSKENRKVPYKTTNFNFALAQKKINLEVNDWKNVLDIIQIALQVDDVILLYFMHVRNAGDIFLKNNNI